MADLSRPIPSNTSTHITYPATANQIKYLLINFYFKVLIFRIMKYIFNIMSLNNRFERNVVYLLVANFLLLALLLVGLILIIVPFYIALSKLKQVRINRKSSFCN